MTRKEYLDLNSTVADTFALHRQYYAQFAPQFISTVIAQFNITRLREALETDKYLNNIPLQAWGALANVYADAMREPLRKHGDGYSLSAGVCILKEAARLAVDQWEAMHHG